MSNGRGMERGQMAKQQDDGVTGVTHEVAVASEDYRAIKEGYRRFDFRWGGNYREGDRLHIRECGPGGDCTGEEMQLHVTHVARVPLTGEPDDLVIMSIVPDLMGGAELV